MEYLLANSISGHPLNDRRYRSETAALKDLVRLGEVFRTMYGVIPLYEDEHWQNILVEGFSPGDLQGILLPQFSIDVYVPGDADTDNIVIGYLIKGVPEAVFPFKNFCSYCRGVKKVDYGDSDTMPHTSIVYVEFDREQFEFRDFVELVDSVCRVSALKPDDFSINFPNSNKVYPYSIEIVEKYFKRRNTDRNRLEQWKANDRRAKVIQKEIEHEMDQGQIAQHFNANDAPASKNPDSSSAQRLVGLTQGANRKKVKPGEVPETIKATVKADAQRNRTNHQITWKEFDKRWAQRLHIDPSKISSIRRVDK